MTGSPLELAGWGLFLLLAGGLPFASTSPRGPAGGPHAGGVPNCVEVVKTLENTDATWQEDAGKNPAGQRQYVMQHLYSLIGFKQGNIAAGKWVGIVIRTTQDGVPSPLFPKLPKDMPGCIFFTYYPSSKRSVAWVQDTTMPFDSRPGYPLENAVYCPHEKFPDPHQTEHPDNKRPETKLNPSACDTLAATFRTTGQPLVVSIPNYRADGDNSVLRQAIIDSLRSRRRGVLTLEDQQLAQRFFNAYIGETGPWFPCTQTGCCRAFSSAQPGT